MTLVVDVVCWKSLKLGNHAICTELIYATTSLLFAGHSFGCVNSGISRLDQLLVGGLVGWLMCTLAAVSLQLRWVDLCFTLCPFP